MSTARAGDPSAGAGSVPAGFEASYAAYYVPLARLAALVLSDREAGEEMAQEAFTRLLSARAVVVDPGAYLRTTVMNLCRSRLRRLRVARRHPDPHGSDVGGPEEATGALAARGPIMEALARLSARQREAVVLRFYAEMSEADIAAAMGISAGTVKTHLHRGLAALGAALEDLR